MKQADIDFWRGAIENTKVWMRARHKVWRRLLKAYELDFEVEGLPEDKTVRVSRFYPLSRQIIASISYNYPHVFFHVEEPGKEFASDILERVANAALEQMDTKAEVQQVIFDALFCDVGWLKFGYNPPGDSDMVAPYTINDALSNDFPYVHRVNPFNIYIDPLTPPHKLSHARYIIEKMIVPLEYVQQDERFSNRRQIQPIDEEDTTDTLLSEVESGAGEEADAVKDAKAQGKMAVLYEVHDRMHRKRITFAESVREPIEEIDHPMLAMRPVTIPDPFTGEEMMTGEFEAEGGYLTHGGFPYYALQFDQTQDSFYGQPPMAYAEDTQKLIVESISRRADLLKRFSRTVLGARRERDANADIGETLEQGRDGDIIWVEDPGSSFRAMDFGNPPPDQLGIERDAREYEEQALNVSQMAMGGGPKLTATQASLQASFGQLNREWMQLRVADCYKTTVHNTLRMMADARYTPEEFLVNVAQDEMEPVFEAVTSDMLRVRFKVDIVAGSTSPITEQLEREDALALFNYTIQLPEINRTEAIKGLLKAFKVSDPEKYLGKQADADAMKLASMENVAYLMKGANPNVTPEENHQIHMGIHGQLQTMPEFQQLLPPQQQQVMAVAQQHLQQHMQALQQKAQGKGGGGAAADAPAPESREVRERGGQEGNIVSMVRSQAQEMSQQVQRAPGQN